MKTVHACLAALALAVGATAARADVFEVGGSMYGTFEFHQVLTFRTEGTYTQHRLAVPTAFLLNDASNLSIPYQASIEVVGVDATPVTYYVIPYNIGELNSGAWIQVINPTPGITFEYEIRLALEGFAQADFYGLIGDVARYTPDEVDYTHPTYYCDWFDPAIKEDAYVQAFANPFWREGALPGKRGDLEQIALLVNTLTYRSPHAWNTLYTASQVWAARAGDCDDLVKLQCALHRCYGTPSRCVLSGKIKNTALGIGDSPEASLHAFGQYWTGARWESFEPGLTENFASASQLVIGVDEDFQNLYPVTAEPPYGYPATFLSQSYASSVTTQYGHYQQRGSRPLGGTRNLFVQTITPGPAPDGLTPSDELGPGNTTGVAPGRAARFAIAPRRMPCSGVMEVELSGLREGPVALTAFDIAGRVVARVPAVSGAGARTVAVRLDKSIPGVYFIVAQQDFATAVAKVVYLGP